MKKMSFLATLNTFLTIYFASIVSSNGAKFKLLILWGSTIKYLKFIPFERIMVNVPYLFT